MTEPVYTEEELTKLTKQVFLGFFVPNFISKLPSASRKSLRAVSREYRVAVDNSGCFKKLTLGKFYHSSNPDDAEIASLMKTLREHCEEIHAFLKRTLTIRIETLEVGCVHGLPEPYKQLLKRPEIWSAVRQLKVSYRGGDYAAVKRLDDDWVEIVSALSTANLPVVESFGLWDRSDPGMASRRASILLGPLLQASWLDGLTELSLTGITKLPEGCSCLFNTCQQLTSLTLRCGSTSVTVYDVDLDADVCKAIANLKRLRKFAATECTFTPRGIAELAKAEWKDMEELVFDLRYFEYRSLEGYHVSEQVIAEFAQKLGNAAWVMKEGARFALTLETGLSVSDMAVLVAAPWFKKLGRLELGDCDLESQHVQQLAQVQFPHLTYLSLVFYKPEVESMCILARHSHNFPLLEEVSVQGDEYGLAAVMSDDDFEKCVEELKKGSWQRFTFDAKDQEPRQW